MTGCKAGLLQESELFRLSMRRWVLISYWKSASRSCGGSPLGSVTHLWLLCSRSAAGAKAQTFLHSCKRTSLCTSFVPSAIAIPDSCGDFPCRLCSWAFQQISPSNPNERGSQVCLAHPRGICHHPGLASLLIPGRSDLSVGAKIQCMAC